MINENELSKILLIEKYKINKSLFNIPLKKFINNLYNKINIPKNSFIISLYYLYKFYNNNKNNKSVLINFFKNINIYIFTCTIINLKHIYDNPINVKNICNLLNINYNNFIKTEIIILKGLDWITLYDETELNNFKMFLGHYKDLFQHMD